MTSPPRPARPPAGALTLGALLALCGALFFPRLGACDLWSSHEGRAAQDAQHMLTRGFWDVPRLFDLNAELQKPPLYYWLVALLGACRGGVDAVAVRLPAALAALATVLALWRFGRRRQRPALALLTPLTLATMLHFTWLARVGRIDMPLTFTVSLALLGLFEAYQARLAAAPALRELLTAYAALAAGPLLKGPIGVVLPAAAWGAFTLVEWSLPAPDAARRRAALRGVLGSLAWGLPLVLALTVPWYWWAGRQTGGALYRSFLWYHNIERAFGGSGGLRAHPWWFYGPRLLVDLLPWGLLLPAAAWSLVRAGRWRDDPAARFGLVWFVAVVGLLSCVRFKRADYLLPAYPGAALLLGAALERWLTARPSEATARISPRLAGAVGVLVGATVAGWWFYVGWLLPAQEPAREQRCFAAEIRRLSPAPTPVIFFRVESHALAFHVGPPLNTIREWENVDAWASRPDVHYLVMSPDCAAAWREHLRTGLLEEVVRNEDLAGGRHEQPLVLLRTVPRPVVQASLRDE